MCYIYEFFSANYFKSSIDFYLDTNDGGVLYHDGYIAYPAIDLIYFLENYYWFSSNEEHVTKFTDTSDTKDCEKECCSLREYIHAGVKRSNCNKPNYHQDGQERDPETGDPICENPKDCFKKSAQTLKQTDGFSFSEPKNADDRTGSYYC